MKYTLLEKMLVQGIAFLQGVILARLLCPEDFGLAAMLGIFLAVGSMFAEGGLGAAYVVYAGKFETGLTGLTGLWVGGLEWKVWKWNVGMALGVYACLAIVAPWIAAFYHQPILRELTWVMGLGIILNAACVVGSARFQRDQEFGKLALVNGAAVFASSIVGVGMAAYGWGVWSIAGVGLSYAFIRLSVLTQVAYATRKVGQDLNAYAPRDTAVGISTSCPVVSTSFGEMLSFGLKSMASGLVHVVYVNLSQLLIGRFYSSAALGLYARGHRWAVLPGEVVNESVGRVSLPALARGETSLGFRVGSLGLRVGWTWVNAALLWPGLVVLWIWAEEIVGFVLGTQWVECVPYLRIIIIGQLFTPISNLALTRLKAAGRADLVLKSDFIKKPIGLIALAVGLPFGVAGLCWAKVVDDITEAVVDVTYTRHLRA